MKYPTKQRMIPAAMRHTVTIMLPSTTLDSRGQHTGSASTVASSVRCSIEPLSGNDLDIARKVYANASMRVRMYVDSSYTITTKHYFVFGSRNLEIGYKNDFQETGFGLELICGEARI